MQLSSKLALVLCAILAAIPTRSAPTATGASDIAPCSPDDLVIGSSSHLDQGTEDLADEGQSLAEIVSFRRSTEDLRGDGGNSFHPSAATASTTTSALTSTRASKRRRPRRKSSI
ncbi:hypothetical protein A4X06_0g5590 [Tilletia controversa]|uniref:Uncharacterized protein n=2 Tax=Tilletia TaxID=13289 RepID=A0A8X7MQS7_9BASI|nr:hypothetical protein CF328_g5146 [Tilletia controversa]KAE8193696.1 hypothetical protein CF336_g3877 [Tilletia laevis]KAE8245567.1 hypothetical protein A4X06_0g5590 [Tilletia controversa]KAE8247733.1 hypothetical protein A4X03_0g6971 [Tilletia caries]